MDDSTFQTVKSIMSTEVHTVTMDDNLGQLKALFSSVNYHHLLVEDEGKLVGVISDRDVARCLSPFLDTEQERGDDRRQLGLSVSEIMATDLITIEADTTIDCASILLLENNISCLPVVANGHFIEGILTWKDILKYHVYGVE